MTTPNLLKDAINDYMDLMNKLRTQNSRITELLRDRARGYCPSCGCDVCNTAGCDSCVWMRKARKFLAELDGEIYQEPSILPPDEINTRNMKLARRGGQS